MRWNYQLFGFLFVCFFVPQSRRLFVCGVRIIPRQWKAMFFLEEDSFFVFW